MIEVGALETGSYILKSLFISGIRDGEIDFFDLVGEHGDSPSLYVLFKLLFIGELGYGDLFSGEQTDFVGESCLYLTYCSKSSKLLSLLTV